jgi:hypothetical protein
LPECTRYWRRGARVSRPARFNNSLA